MLYNYFLFYLDIKAEKRRKSEEVDPMDPSSYSDAPRYFSINQGQVVQNPMISENFDFIFVAFQQGVLFMCFVLQF